MAAAHRFTFFRAGGFDQVKLTTADDLRNLEHLDQKLWVALACPTLGLELDQRTLDLVDSDADERVRAPELIAAVKFALDHLKQPDDLLKGAPALPVSAINTKTESGKVLAAAARQVLGSLDKPSDAALTAEDFSDRSKLFANTAFNGDGIITELSTEDPELRLLITQIAECLGSEVDRAGKPGVNADKVRAFFDDVAAYSAWQGRAPAATESFPFNADKTASALQLLDGIRAKIDDYFARCRLAAFDARLGPLLNRKEEDYANIATQDFSAAAEQVKSFPVAQAGADRPLPLIRGINPAYAGLIKQLREELIVPLLGVRDQLSQAEWTLLSERFATYATWWSEKPKTPVDKLGSARILEVQQLNLRTAIEQLIEKDLELLPQAESIENLERLVRYHRDLFKLCENFVNFREFYGGGHHAVFQSGTLYLDRRSCDLCLRVNDPAKHAQLAGLAGAYLAYCDCKRKGGAETMQIVAAFTDGDSDQLMVGRNGLFYDRQGNDWDATITKIVENPISLREAFWSPYKKFVRMIEEQVAKRAAAADAEANTHLGAAALSTAHVDKPPPAPAAGPQKVDVGTVAALGVAVGAIGTFFTTFLGYATGLLSLGPLAIVGAAIGVILLISLPSVILAFIKLRKRSLAPILDANGWAVNANARINVPFGAALTNVAKLPAGSRREPVDLYAERGLPWKRWALLAVVVYLAYSWQKGSLDRFLPEGTRARDVLHDFAAEPGPSPREKR